MKTSKLILVASFLLGAFYCQQVQGVGKWDADSTGKKDQKNQADSTQKKTFKLNLNSPEDLQNLLKMFSGQLNANGAGTTGAKAKGQADSTQTKTFKLNLNSPEDLQNLLKMFSGQLNVNGVGTTGAKTKGQTDSTQTKTLKLNLNSPEDLQNLLKMFSGQLNANGAGTEATAVKATAVKALRDGMTERTSIMGKSVIDQKAPELLVERWITEAPKTKGKFLLLDYYGTTCGPCRVAIPKLNEWHKLFKKDMVVIGFARDDSKNKNLGIEYYRTNDVRTFAPLDLHVLSYVLLVDPKGIVRWEGICKDLTTDKVKEIIAKYK